jgi:hypothetical protein
MASGILGSAQNSLPTELVLLVVDHLAGDNKTLCTLARTCRALQHLAEEQIYKTIELFTVRDLHDIIEAFTYRHQRARAVQTLKLQYHYNVKDLDENTNTRGMFNECVAHMVNLREWHIESPYDNCHWDDEGDGPHQWVEGDMERFRAALESACIEGPVEAQHIQAERRLGNAIDRTVGLALLESLTIHSHGIESDFWDLDGFHCLFRHPTLRHLHVSCVSFTEDFPMLRSHASKTPLTTLIFDECEISPASLDAILHTPARLKHLTLGENVWNTRRSKRIKPRLTRNASASLQALSAVAHSLESLTHWDPSWKLDHDSHKARRMSPSGNGMREFHALKYMQCETTSFLHQAVIMNHEVAPPNLKTLRLCRHWNVPFDFFDQPPDVETYLALPSLSTLELMQSSHCLLYLSLPEYICEAERLRNRHAYAYKLFKAGINLEVLVEMHEDGGLIPPFLYGEPTPITHCLYDAQDVGFRRRVTNFGDIDAVDQAANTNSITNSDAVKRTFAAHAASQRAAADNGGHAATVPIQPDTATSAHEELPETDQLGDIDVLFLTSQMRHSIHQLKQHFKHFRNANLTQDPSDDGFITTDDLSGAEFDDDFDDEDGDLEMDEDDLGVVFHEHNGQLYIEVYESETEEEEEEEDDSEMEELDDDGMI